ncbi:MAG: hypothetical protein ABEJ92_06070 [Halobacteriales archaeon]
MTVKQDPGNVFYWVVPGNRRLSETVFGIPDDPRARLDHEVELASRLPSPLGSSVAQLLRDLPILVGLPMQARTVSDGAFGTTTMATPFGDEGRPTAGELQITYHDRRPYDRPGPPVATPDDVDLTASFEDPAGNTYDLEVGQVFQPPIPGYETGGGVMTNAWHHGITDTGSPLMPRVYTYGAFWGIGNVRINGELADERKVMHFMTTQNVRKSNYDLALDDELPLRAEETIGGQVHHTHGIVLPITMGQQGPQFAPVETAFELPNGQPQPFIHAMWEQDTVVDAYFADWTPAETASNVGVDVRVTQEPGNVFYWVLPGKRRLSERVFGTPDAPRMTLAPKLRAAERQFPEPLAGKVKQLLQDLPILVGLPPGARESDGGTYTTTAMATPFGDTGRPTSGELDITYRDRRPYDLPGGLTDTPDDVDLTANFEDPAGNAYDLEVGQVFQPPVPGYETGGGVMVNAWHHGISETGSPLMPRVYTYGAFWGVGNVVINGEVADERKVMHFMTTQNVRRSDYGLALDEELPLAPEDTIGGQVHHTHGIVLPVTVTPEGPEFAPVKTAFELPNGQNQPFIHAMWEQDTIQSHPFKGWTPGE